MTPNRDSGRHFTNRDLNWDKQPPRLDDSFKLGDPILDDTGENDKTELIAEAEQRNETPAEIMERKEFSATETYESQPFSSAKKKSKNKARFSDEQIRSLESIFETETKLEPRKKMEVAGELGLQPRQVAIWFQNKRARWKSKQIEQDLRILRANYDSLSSKFETLQEEKKVLLSQLQKISGLLDKPRCSSTTNGDQADEKARNRLQEELEEPETEHSYEYQNNGIIRSVEDEGCEFEVTNPDEEKRNYINYVEEDGRQLWNISEQLHASLTSASFDNSCCSSEWLNFWS